MVCLIVGSSGQLGRAVTAAVQAQAGWQVITRTHRELDISRPETAAAVAALAPDVVINCAAWTAVDEAEAQPDAAYAVNALGPLHLAQGCAACGAALVQVSTNEVFAGAPGVRYYEYDTPAPASVYARSKRAGEVAAATVLQQLYVVRVAWLFGPGGNHFPAKMVAAADRHAALRVVDDEYGNPTYAPDVADAIVALLRTQRFGIYHLVNEGRASRFDLAQAVLAATGRGDVPLTPIGLDEWPRPATPPRHAVLVNQAAAALGIVLRPWQDALAAYLAVEGTRFAMPKPV